MWQHRLCLQIALKIGSQLFMKTNWKFVMCMEHEDGMNYYYCFWTNLRTATMKVFKNFQYNFNLTFHHYS